MQTQIINKFIRESPKLRFNQGDILKDVTIIAQTDFDESQNDAIISEISLSYAIIINQDCDLEQDFNVRNNAGSTTQDKYLPNIFILPAYLANKFREGSHRGEEIKCMVWSSKELWKNIVNNNNSRFHFINSNEQLQIPELVVDFKHLFTINRDILYKDVHKVYLASICEIYRESISHRYSFYLSRIGLPE